MVSNCGNSFRNNSNALPSEAMITLKLCVSNALIIGMHRVACPKPQYKGATRIVLAFAIKTKVRIIAAHYIYLVLPKRYKKEYNWEVRISYADLEKMKHLLM